MNDQPPKKWQALLAKYWGAIVAIGGFLLITLNVLVGLNFWSERAIDWINTSIAALVALGVWLKAHQGKLEKLTGIDVDQDGVEG